MSEESVRYFVPCLSGNNAFADCLIEQRGDALQISGYAEMVFTAQDAITLAHWILARFEKSKESQSMVDPVVEAVCEDLLDRSRLGIAKYGTMLNRTDLTLDAWLVHAYQEGLDQVNYLKRAILDMKNLMDDGK
jgi:hypothetical protein